jgi:hypothetical protein
MYRNCYLLEWGFIRGTLGISVHDSLLSYRFQRFCSTRFELGRILLFVTLTSLPICVHSTDDAKTAQRYAPSVGVLQLHFPNSFLYTHRHHFTLLNRLPLQHYAVLR